MRITAKKLREAEACEPDIAKFEKQWPDGCNVTQKNCLIAFVELGLDPEWAVYSLFDPTTAAGYYADTQSAWIKGLEASPSDAHWKKFRKVAAIAFWRAAKGDSTP